MSVVLKKKNKTPRRRQRRNYLRGRKKSRNVANKKNLKFVFKYGLTCVGGLLLSLQKESSESWSSIPYLWGASTENLYGSWLMICLRCRNNIFSLCCSVLCSLFQCFLIHFHLCSCTLELSSAGSWSSLSAAAVKITSNRSFGLWLLLLVAASVVTAR